MYGTSQQAQSWSLRLLGLMFMASVGGIACSTHYRTVDPGVSSSQMFEKLDAALGTQSSQTVGDTNLSALANSDSTEIFFAENSNAFGAIPAVTSITDFGFLDSRFAGLTVLDMIENGLTGVQVFFLDGFDNNGNRVFALVVKLDGQGLGGTYVFTSESAEMSDRQLVINMRSAQSEIVVETTDIAGNGQDLAATIQLRVFDSARGGVDVGKFSYLAGFSR